MNKYLIYEIILQEIKLHVYHFYGPKPGPHPRKKIIEGIQFSFEDKVYVFLLLEGPSRPSIEKIVSFINSISGLSKC